MCVREQCLTLKYTIVAPREGALCAYTHVRVSLVVVPIYMYGKLVVCTAAVAPMNRIAPHVRML